ncbi:hypothetical protein BJ165DRAFT_195219 [Panaeolus papilionaceus]|nr:hypothetical protein BJ165DRAFT_195219 [Panaeolus papilionaceus]
MVEHLIIDYSGPFALDIKVARSLIGRCPNIWNIALWSHNITNILDAISTVKNLRRLSANFFDVTKEQMAEPVFAALTHLELLQPCSDWPFEALRSLRYLTHLSYFVTVDLSFESKIPVIVSSCKPLDAVIVCIPERQRPSNASSFECLSVYPQLVFFDYSMNHANDWIKGARGGCDIWCHADHFVFARKQKYFISDDYQKRAISKDFDWMEHLTEDGKRWYLSLHA